MRIIFCISNLFVPATLSLIEQFGGEPVVVYTDQSGISHFFRSLQLENVTIYHRDELPLKNNIRIIIQYFAKRSKILSQLRAHEISDIYFFHNSFGNLENWLIKKLSSNSKVYHIPIFNNLPFDKKFKFSIFRYLLFSFFFNGVRIEPLWNGEIFIFKTADSFFKAVKAQKFEITIDDKYIKKLIDEKFNFGEKKIVLLTGSIVELGQVEEQEYVSRINALIQAIGKERILVKPHPRFPNRYGLEKELELVPPYIPANVLFAKFKIYIGYTTTTLSEAANQGLMAISLLEYLEALNKDRMIKYKKYLNENLEKNTKIHYVNYLENILDLTKEKNH